MALACLKDSSFATKTERWLERERKFLFERLTALEGLHPLASRTNFLLVKIERSHGDALRLRSFLLQKNILIRACDTFAASESTISASRSNGEKTTNGCWRRLPNGRHRADSGMAKQIILVTGGARSGKSRYAEQRAAELGARRLYVATAEAKDEEMAQRIAEHKKRRGNEWTTIEEPLELTEVLLAQRGRTDCALVDCLTLWLSNLLLRRDAKYAEEKVEELVKTLPRLDFHRRSWSPTRSAGASCRIIRWRGNFATSQAGPINASRRAANEVVLTVAGIPMIVKKATSCP